MPETPEAREWCETKRSWSEAIPCDDRINTACLGGDVGHANGESKGCWATSGSVRAFRKPDRIRLSNPEPAEYPFHEFVASRLARELHVKVPRIELAMRADGPVAYVFEISSTISYSHMRSHEPCQVLLPCALASLDSFAGIIVLDALMGATNRPSSNGNHIYSLATQTWWSLDYSTSFSEDFEQPYEPPFVEAVRRSWARISTTELELAQNLDAAVFERIAYAAPEEYASPEERRRILEFLRKRQKQLRDVIVARFQLAS